MIIDITVPLWWEQFGCAWFATCDNAATGVMAHPMAPETGLPICGRCEAWCERQSDGRSRADMISRSA